jgi:hypothetical protein
MWKLGAVLIAGVLAACSAEDHVAAAEVTEEPLSEPEPVELTEPGGICYQAEDEIPLLNALPGIDLTVAGELGQIVEREGDGSTVAEFSGQVLDRLDQLPDAARQHFNPELDRSTVDKSIRRLREEYPVAVSFAAKGETHWLAGRTRSLGLRRGMRFDAHVVHRRAGGFNWDNFLTIRSGGETVLHHVHGSVSPEELELPDGLRAEREQVLCRFGPALAGDQYSLRVSNEAGESIVLAPGQAHTLGDYDVYLWSALYPVEGSLSLAGIDAPNAIVELAVIRRLR